MTTGPERGLLDTSVVIDLADVPEGHLPATATISAIAVAELSQGPHLTRDTVERTRRLEQLLTVTSRFKAPLPFDDAAARRYGSLVAMIVVAGRSPRPRRFDLMIAAIAAVNDLPLYTRNGDDFLGLHDAVDLRAI